MQLRHGPKRPHFQAPPSSDAATGRGFGRSKRVAGRTKRRGSQRGCSWGGISKSEEEGEGGGEGERGEGRRRGGGEDKERVSKHSAICLIWIHIWTALVSYQDGLHTNFRGAFRGGGG